MPAAIAHVPTISFPYTNDFAGQIFLDKSYFAVLKYSYHLVIVAILSFNTSPAN
ncbi:MAG: hypothetical protein WCP92_09170 [bacterium]